jgi:hypothetical protein
LMYVKLGRAGSFDRINGYRLACDYFTHGVVC